MMEKAINDFIEVSKEKAIVDMESAYGRKLDEFEKVSLSGRLQQDDRYSLRPESDALIEAWQIYC
jgi:hypothetical protein